jgi:hypothetical protein
MECGEDEIKLKWQDVFKQKGFANNSLDFFLMLKPFIKITKRI